jgi:hypothetical protein
MISGQGRKLFEISIVAPDDAYAAADDDVLHFDGNTWQSLSATLDKNYEDVWSLGPSDIYAAGDELTHFDGSIWKPAIPIVPPFAQALWADTRGRIVVGSDDGVYRWENGEWRKEEFGSRTVMTIEGDAWDDLYAGTFEGVYHSDGDSWTLMPGSPDYIDEMSVVASGEIFGSAGGTLYRFDTQGWTRIKEVNVSGSEAVWAFDAQHVLFGYPDGIWQMEDSSWTKISTERCTSIWALSPHDIYAVLRGFIKHSDGQAFIQVGPVIPGGFDEIVGISESHIIARGYDGYSEWRDGRWTAGTTPQGWRLFEIAAARDGSFVQLARSRSGHYRLSYLDE